MLDDPLRKNCPVCGQLQGNRCHDEDGHLMDGFHAERLYGDLTPLRDAIRESQDRGVPA
jgi:hypothetical protein